MSGGKAERSAPFDPAPFSDEVLEAASSRGLLRRARRDVESGLVSLAGQDDGTALVRADGESVRLPGGPLAGARCTCPATGLCRHILAGILLLRDADETQPQEDAAPADTSASPAAPDAQAEILALEEAVILRAFGRAAHVRAQALLAALDEGAIRIEASPAAMRIELGDHPVVLYPAGGGPAGMVSRAARADRAALHAAALLAVRGPVEPPAGVEVPPAGTSDAATGMLEEAAALLRDAVRQALSKAPAGLEERIGDLALSSRAEAMPRLAAELRAVAATIRRRRERLDADDPADILVMLARAYALAQALRGGSGDPLLTGAGGQAPQPLPAIDLVGCGLRLWRTASGARGVTGYYLGADGRTFSATLARAAGSDPGFTPTHAATGEATFGRSLAGLAGVGFRLEDARASADGRLHTGSGRAGQREARWAAALETIDGAVIDDWNRCAAATAAAFRPRLAQPPRRGLPLVLRPASLGPLRFDAVAQTGHWPVSDRDGQWLELEIAGDERLESAFDLLGALDGRRPPFLAVIAEARGEDIVLSPLGFGTDSLTLLDLPPPKQAGQKEGLLARLGRGFALPGFSLPGFSGRKETGATRFASRARPQATSLRLISAALDELLALAELGGRMEDPERLQRIEHLGRRLDEAGLALPGRLVARFAAAPAQARADHLLRAAYALDLVRRIDPRLPFVRPL